MNVSEQINSVIDKLAEKLGVAVDALLPLLVRQSYIKGIVNLVWVVICVTLIIINSKSIIKRYRKYGSFDDMEEFDGVAVMLQSLVVAASGIIAAVCLTNAMYALGNPTWFAINDLIQSLK